MLERGTPGLILSLHLGLGSGCKPHAPPEAQWRTCLTRSLRGHMNCWRLGT